MGAQTVPDAGSQATYVDDLPEGTLAPADARDLDDLADLAQIRVPTLYLCGRESPAAMNAISNLFRLKLPWAHSYQFSSMGHLGPITHSDIVNEQIAGFIQRLSGIAYASGYARAA